VKTIKAPKVPNIFDREILPFQKVVYMGHIKKFDDPLYSTVAAKCRTWSAVGQSLTVWCCRPVVVTGFHTPPQQTTDPISVGRAAVVNPHQAGAAYVSLATFCRQYLECVHGLPASADDVTYMFTNRQMGCHCSPCNILNSVTRWMSLVGGR